MNFEGLRHRPSGIPTSVLCPEMPSDRRDHVEWTPAGWFAFGGKGLKWQQRLDPRRPQPSWNSPQPQSALQAKRRQLTCGMLIGHRPVEFDPRCTFSAHLCACMWMAQIRVCEQAFVCGLIGYGIMVHLSKGRRFERNIERVGVVSPARVCNGVG